MDVFTWLQDQSEQIVRRGHDVRQQVAALASGAAERAARAREGFAGLARSVLTGASRGVDAATPQDRTRTLRDVIDGLGDGFAVAAQAAKLALQEAASGSVRYAKEDVDRLVVELRSFGESFGGAVADGVAAGLRQGAGVGRDLADHAAVTLRRTWPSFDAALGAAAADPLGLARQAASAGVGAARGAAGVLFEAFGKQLAKLGTRLQGGTSTPGDR